MEVAMDEEDANQDGSQANSESRYGQNKTIILTCTWN